MSREAAAYWIPAFAGMTVAGWIGGDPLNNNFNANGFNVPIVKTAC
jgi:hypothetical protein